MYLKKVDIENFRSIKKLSIDFDPQCRVLVGINESGKSNILRALSMLDDSAKLSKEDKREVPHDEPPISKSYVRFVFSFSEQDRDSILKAFLPQVLVSNLKDPILTKDDKQLTIEEFCLSKQEGLYYVDVLSGQKYGLWWALNDGYKISPQWKKPNPKNPNNLTVLTSEETSVSLKDFVIINCNDYPDIDDAYLSDLTPQDLNNLFGRQIGKYVQENKPETLYWTYDEKNLLPAQINLAAFVADPTSCMPLKNMFELAEITDVENAVEEANNISVHGLRNLLNRVAERATKHLVSIWKEYKAIKIQLLPNGENIDATVQEKYNHYAFSRRSDGFKRFITFLLMVSARVRTQALNNAFLLIDEPDSGLHPSGSRYLRDELIKISEANYVVYSTHSIFMIDRNNIGRHLIVTKKDEVTSITKVDESNIIDEEVIYNALGYSIFESLNGKNILFEGWRDKWLFQVAIKNLPT